MGTRRAAATHVILTAALLAACGAPKLPEAAPRGAQPAVAGSPLTLGAGARIASQQAAPPPKPVEIRPFPAPNGFSDGTWTYYAETGHYVAGGFKRYFDAAGGPGALGFPITEELFEDGCVVQYFQRGRLDFHPEYAQPIQRALLGDSLLDIRGRGDLVKGSAPAPGARVFPETGVWVAPPHLDYFDRNGGVPVFGYPVGDPVDGVQWFQRGRLEANAGSVQAALIGDEYTDAAGLEHARTRAQPPQIARANQSRAQDDLEVLAAPGGTVATRLPQDAQLRVTGETVAGGEGWYAVQLWNSLDGYVRRDSLAFTSAPDKRPGVDVTPFHPALPPPQGPFSLQATGAVPAAFDLAATPDGPPSGRLAGGTAVQITAWATDARGRAWYAVASPAGTGWIVATAVRLDRPATARPDLLAAASGKGMWFTYDTLRNTPAANVVAAARANGLTFLAPEVGSSRRGYWGDGELDALLDAAHAGGVKVIPWVYPWLVDLPGDLDLALRAARHVSPSGQRVDGLGVDLEENLEEAPNYVFGQVLRAQLGSDVPLVALTYQPQIASGRVTPYATIALSFDVLAPMSYWHGRPIAYRGQDASTYVADSVRLVRERAGRPDLPVAVVGQAFDWFSRNEIGPGNPTGEEVRGAIGAAHNAGAVGIGFFNWFSTTPEEWDAIRDAQWP